MADKFKWGKLIGKGKKKDNTINMMAPLEPDPPMAPVVDLNNTATNPPTASQPPVAPPAQQVNETPKEERAPLVIEWNTYQEEQRQATGTEGQLVTAGGSNQQSQVQNYGGAPAPMAPPTSAPTTPPVSHAPIAPTPSVESAPAAPATPPTGGFSWDAVLNPGASQEAAPKAEPEIPAEHAPDNGMGPITRGWDDVELTPSEKNTLDTSFRGQENGPISMDTVKDATPESIANNPAWDEPTSIPAPAAPVQPPVSAAPPAPVTPPVNTPPVEAQPPDAGSNSPVQNEPSIEEIVNQAVETPTYSTPEPAAPFVETSVAPEPESAPEPTYSAPLAAQLGDIEPIPVPETNTAPTTEEVTTPPANVSPEAAQAPAWNTTSATAGSFGLQNPFEAKQEEPVLPGDSAPEDAVNQVEPIKIPDFESNEEFDWSSLEAFAKQKADEDKLYAQPAAPAPQEEPAAEVAPISIEEPAAETEVAAAPITKPIDDQPSGEFSWSKIMGAPASQGTEEVVEAAEETVVEASEEVAEAVEEPVTEANVEEIPVAEVQETPATEPEAPTAKGTPTPESETAETAQPTSRVNWDALEETAAASEPVLEEAIQPIAQEPVVSPPAPPVQEQVVADARADIPEQYKRILDESEFDAAKEVRVGDLLLQNGLITQAQLDRALERQNESREKLGQVLISMNIMSEERLLQAVAAQKGVNPWHLQHDAPSLDAVKMLPEGTCRMFQALPVAIRDNHLVVAMRDPSDEEAKHSLAAVAKMEIEVVLADDARLAYAIDKSFGLNEAKRIAGRMSKLRWQ
ncbi:MAG: hypothetical protein R2688_10080 [Fimbriimonadaceae bacterium]